MERLTRLIRPGHKSVYSAGDYTSTYRVTEVTNRLAEYENTDLTPEEIELMKLRNREMKLYITCLLCTDQKKNENVLCPRCKVWEDRYATEQELKEKLGILPGQGTGEVMELL